MSGPVKRSVTIAGHETSVSLEPIFWDALRAAAAERSFPINALIAEIDAERISAPNPANLGSAIRVWLYERATSKLHVALELRIDREAGIEGSAG